MPKRIELFVWREVTTDDMPLFVRWRSVHGKRNLLPEALDFENRLSVRCGWPSCHASSCWALVITFHVRHSRGEMYNGYGRLCVCVSVSHAAQNWWLVMIVWDLVYSLSEPDFQVHFYRVRVRVSHTVGHAGSATCIVHADMTLTRSKVKIKVTGLLKFRYTENCTFLVLSPPPFWRVSKLMVDYDSIEPSLQLFGARFVNFSPSWRSRDFQVREMLKSTRFCLRAAWG